MIIWGWTTKNIGQKVTDFVCSHCNQEGLIMVTFQKFFTLFLLPAFPTGREHRLVCGACSTEYDPKVMELDVSEYTHQVKTPLWGFSGLAAFVLVISVASIWLVTDHRMIDDVKASPQANDIIVIEVPNSKRTPYVSLKIQEVKDGVILFKESMYAYSHKDSAKKAASGKDSDSEFSEEIFEMPISDLKELNVVSVKR